MSLNGSWGRLSSSNSELKDSYDDDAEPIIVGDEYQRHVVGKYSEHGWISYTRLELNINVTPPMNSGGYVVKLIHMFSSGYEKGIEIIEFGRERHVHIQFCMFSSNVWESICVELGPARRRSCWWTARPASGWRRRRLQVSKWRADTRTEYPTIWGWYCSTWKTFCTAD